MTIHQHDLQLLMAELFKTKNNLYPTFMKNVFTERDLQCNLRSKPHLQLPNVKTARWRIESIQYIGHHLWASVPGEINDSGTLTDFKQKAKSWKGSTCICFFPLKAPFTRERFLVELYQNRRDRPRVYMGTDGTVPYRTASGTRTVHLESRFRTEPNQKVLV